MYGGSYNGFTQWAATKTLHPALKTIVPYVSNRLGMGTPMENNVFINPNYGTGKEVRDETILDVKEPLIVKWYTDSYVKIPIWKE